jgi:hypothetical protein
MLADVGNSEVAAFAWRTSAGEAGDHDPRAIWIIFLQILT